MRRRLQTGSLGLAVMVAAASALGADGNGPKRWSAAKARAWYERQPWLCGFNYVPSTAVNTTELWQADTFYPTTIDRELGWAEAIGLNSCRVFVQYLVWENDPKGLIERMDRFLSIATRHKISTMFCLFDDCAFAGKQPYLGKQDDPIPGVHNSGWTPSPGHDRVVNRAVWPKLQQYVQDVIGRFANDKRVVVWDLYNEPGNVKMHNKSLPLVEAAFAWARAAKPSQPLTIAVWTPALKELNEKQLTLSDVISFHNYGGLKPVRKHVAELQAHDRPILCTEWMRRTGGSVFETHLPFFREKRVGCYFWGLINGKTQTQFPWGSPKGAPEPKVWFHDILRKDGTPYRQEEISIIRRILGGQ